MYVSSIGAINNAAFGGMQAKNGIQNLARGSAEGSFGNLASIHNSEKKLQSENLKNQLIYDASSLIEEAQRKQEKENIKRSFSTFG